MAATKNARLDTGAQPSLPFELTPPAEDPAIRDTRTPNPKSLGHDPESRLAPPDAPRATPDARLATPDPRRANPESRIPNPELIICRHPKAKRYILRVADDGAVPVT